MKDLLINLDPVTLIEFKNYLVDNLTNFCCEKNSNAKIISNNKAEKDKCSFCERTLNKNGKTKSGIQKYICPNCKKTTSETTNKITYCSKITFDVWKNIIDNLIDGFSIRRISEENSISILTSFRIRHKILIALDDYINSIQLKNSIQSDEKYFSINLKGTKPHNMPRKSKKKNLY